MRLWHKGLISVLPRKQLLGQWRECCLIVKNIAEKGTPNHILVNRIMDYNIGHFLVYSGIVVDELKRRNYKVDTERFDKWYRQLDLSKERLPSDEDLFRDWHNDRYLMQCLNNLQEKYDCGGISEAEWNTIITKFSLKKLQINKVLEDSNRIEEVILGDTLYSIYLSNNNEYVFIDAYNKNSIVAVMTKEFFDSIFEF